jgi:hypothetical protein
MVAPVSDQLNFDVAIAGQRINGRRAAGLAA